MSSAEKLRLGVNIDHVATVRNARGGDTPDPLRAAKMAEEAGADGITAHLREDRRHISDETGERDLIESRFADICAFHTMGEGFTWETQDKTRDIEMAQAAWEKSKELIRDPKTQMVLLDEINIALRYGYLDVAEVVDFLKTEKPEMTHVILTGRNAADEVIEIADLVTEMELVKHPFRSGVKAQAGVEF